MPQSWDMGHIILLPLRRKDTEDFPDTRIIQRYRPGLNPRTRVPVASMLTTRPPKPSRVMLSRHLFQSPKLSNDFPQYLVLKTHNGPASCEGIYVSREHEG
jgi:hypothetical protein